MARRTLVLVVVGVLALLGAATAYGRWESQRALDAERRHMLEVYDLVGGELLSPSVSDYWGDGWYTCFRYWAGKDPFALSICFDPNGRFIEAVDARSGKARFYSIRYQPASAPLTLDPAEIKAAVGAIDREQRKREAEAAG